MSTPMTSYGSYTRGTLTSWEELSNLDPSSDLVLTDDQREAMASEASVALEKAIDSALPDGFTVLGNGEIIGPVGGELDLVEVRQEVDGSEWWESVLKKYFDWSE